MNKAPHKYISKSGMTELILTAPTS